MFLKRKLQEFVSKYMSNTNICYIFMGLTFVVPYYLKVFVTVLPYLRAILACFTLAGWPDAREDVPKEQVGTSERRQVHRDWSSS